MTKKPTFFFMALLMSFFSVSVSGAENWKNKSEEFWKKKLTPEQYSVCRQAGTERPGSGKYNKFKEKGVFTCSSCGQELFSSDTKFESGTGWPSFWQPINPKNVDDHDDSSLGMKRTEVRCSRCGAHLGHVFDDGPPPTGKRYCINSVCLDFVPKKK
jgi:peptide-methionine (R)-S-oxide reductase